MKYYRVRESSDNLYDRETEYTTVSHELLTARERKNMFPSIPDRNFEKVNVGKNHTYFSFGARFECE
jgi:hypothetical protein